MTWNNIKRLKMTIYDDQIHLIQLSDCSAIWLRMTYYYLPNKNLPAHFEQLLLNNSSNLIKIGDQIEALQISELVVQTASL